LKGLGKGSFGDVVKAFDHKTKEHRAVKIIRNERRFHKQAQVEVKVLEMLKKNDRRNNHNLIHIKEWFVFRNHLCISFDLLHQDMYTALKKDGFKGFALPQVGRGKHPPYCIARVSHNHDACLQVRNFATSLLACLRLLRRQKVIHCDLKPENILLTDKQGDDITVLAFGTR
jgi:dual specificity tyrosine-phosphorylation-regulated kinase 2/3/4